MVPYMAHILTSLRLIFRGIGVTTLCDPQSIPSRKTYGFNRQITAVVSGSLAYGAVALAKVRVLGSMC